MRLKVDNISYKGQPINKLPNARISQHSSVSKLICNTDFENWDAQINKTILYLKRNREKLIQVKNYKGVEYAGINLALNSRIYRSNLLQSIYFPEGLIKICSDLSFHIETTLFAPDLEERLEKRWKTLKRV